MFGHEKKVKKDEYEYKDPYEPIRKNEFLMNQFYEMEGENIQLRDLFVNEWRCPEHKNVIMKILNVTYQCSYCKGEWTTGTKWNSINKNLMAHDND